MRSNICCAIVLAGGTVAVTNAQSVVVDAVDCLPRAANTVFTASVAPEISRSESVRLYFRRLNPAGGYYWIEMLPAGDGAYSAVLPKPEGQEQPGLTDEWWSILQHRDWLAAAEGDRGWLDELLKSQDYEAAEYYVAIVDPRGEEVARTETFLAEVRDLEDCAVGLTRHQMGLSQSLVVGETLESQRDRPVFHWLCDGIVSRFDAEGVLRPDSLCRACVVAGAIAPLAAGGVVAATAIEKREPRSVSPVQ